MKLHVIENVNSYNYGDNRCMNKFEYLAQAYSSITETYILYNVNLSEFALICIGSQVQERTELHSRHLL